MTNQNGLQLLDPQSSAERAVERLENRPSLSVFPSESKQESWTGPEVNRPLSWSERLSWWLDPRSWVRAILMLDDCPHSIALGTAIGVFVAFTPTVGIQMLIVMVVAFLTRRLFHFNRVAALIAVYLSNPFTTVPIYWFNYRVGAIFWKGTVSHAEFAQMFQYGSFAAWWGSFQTLFVRVGMPLLVGSVVVGAFFSLATYPVMFRLLDRVQRHRHRKDLENSAQNSDLS